MMYDSTMVSNARSRPIKISIRFHAQTVLNYPKHNWISPFPRQHFYHLGELVKSPFNSPFLSCCLSWFQSESLCTTIRMQMRGVFSWKSNLLSLKWFSSKTHFEPEANSNLEMAYSTHEPSLKCLWSKKYLLLSLKTFQNHEEWWFLCSREIQVFVQKLVMSQTVHMTVINHKIENISKNIAWVLFKLGSSDLRQVRHKMISSNFAAVSI